MFKSEREACNILWTCHDEIRNGNIITTWKMEDQLKRKSRGRPRIKHLDVLNMCLQKENTELIHSVSGRQKEVKRNESTAHGSALEEEEYH